MDDYFAKVPFDWVTAGTHVGAHAEEGVVLEQARSDRMPGHARAQYEDSYRYPTYDAEVDTGMLDPDAAAAMVVAGWRARRR